VRVLVDTHALLFWLFDDHRLSAVARAHLADPTHEVLVSAASAWEIATQHRLGKLTAADVLVQDIPGWIQRARFTELPISMEHAQRAGALRHAHRDPFDRMIAAQGALEDVPVISRDAVLEEIGVRLIW
jgi:PIN domain nuclease of toxin-antitoxin system